MCKAEVELVSCTSMIIREKGSLTPVEIKSGGTFSVDFVRGLERFQALGLKRLTTGAVLYNGEQRFNVHGARIFNPLLVEDIRETLTAPAEQGNA